MPPATTQNITELLNFSRVSSWLNDCGTETGVTSTGDLCMLMLFITIMGITMIGNMLVVLSVILYPTMHTVGNWLIVSLACADLLVTVCVLPLSALHTISQLQWILGAIVCDFWITADVFCCTASILNIVVIAVDRFLLITRNLRYTHHHRLPRQHLCIIMVTCAWLSSLIIACLPLIGWRTGQEKREPCRCIISQDLSYTVFSTLTAFWCPLFVILVLYCKIFFIANRRAQARARQHSATQSLVAATVALAATSTHHRHKSPHRDNVPIMFSSSSACSLGTLAAKHNIGTGENRNRYYSRTCSNEVTQLLSVRASSDSRRSLPAEHVTRNTTIGMHLNVIAEHTSESFVSSETTNCTRRNSSCARLCNSNEKIADVDLQTDKYDTANEALRMTNDQICMTNKLLIENKCIATRAEFSSDSCAPYIYENKTNDCLICNSDITILGTPATALGDPTTALDSPKTALDSPKTSLCSPITALGCSTTASESLMTVLGKPISYIGINQAAVTVGSYRPPTTAKLTESTAVATTDDMTMSGYKMLMCTFQLIDDDDEDDCSTIYNKDIITECNEEYYKKLSTGQNEISNINFVNQCRKPRNESNLLNANAQFNNAQLGNINDNLKSVTLTDVAQFQQIDHKTPVVISQQQAVYCNVTEDNSYKVNDSLRLNDSLARLRNFSRDYNSRIRKSALTLGLIIGAFIICWLPFFILATLSPFCARCQASLEISSVVVWLGYSNSLANPIIYAITDKAFRRCFRRIFRCDFKLRCI